MSSDLEKLHNICNKTYKEQAVWFLNCFWEDFASSEAELFWQYVLKNNELDLENHEQGSGLDEMKAHVFLEKFDETLTVREMRDRLRSTGAIGQNERPKLVPLTHYLLYKYNADWRLLIDESRQGDNKEEMEKAEKLVAEVQKAFQESERSASAARKALLEAQSKEADAKARENEAVQRENEAVQRENEAKASEEQARQREATAKASAESAKQTEAQANKDAEASKQAEQVALSAQRELEEALRELHAQEEAYNQKKAELERKSEEGGVVSRNKAKAELAQHLAEDPLPLRRAKITQEAAVKKAERATQAAADARQAAEASAAAATKARTQAEADASQAESARRSAEQAAAEASKARQSASDARQTASRARESAEAAARASAQAKAQADAALEEAQRRLKEAEDYLEEVKQKPGQSYGSLWWIDRELYEQRKYLPVSKGGIAK